MRGVAFVTKTPEYIQAQTRIHQRWREQDVHKIVIAADASHVINRETPPLVVIFLALPDAILFERANRWYEGIYAITDSPLAFVNYPMIQRMDFRLTPKREILIQKLEHDWVDHMLRTKNYRIYRRSTYFVREVIEANSKDRFLASYQALMYSVSGKETRTSLKNAIIRHLFDGSETFERLEIELFRITKRSPKAREMAEKLLDVLRSEFGKRFAGACADVCRRHRGARAMKELGDGVFKILAVQHNVDDFELRYLWKSYHELTTKESKHG